MAIGLYHLLAGFPRRSPTDALAAAGRESASRRHAAASSAGGCPQPPTWRIIRTRRGPQAHAGSSVDGVDGSIVAHFVEDNPEDWSEFTADQRKTTAS